MNHDDHKELICIVCPIGCRLTVTKSAAEDEGFLVEGNKCNRGHGYAIKEMTNPTRVVTSTVIIRNGFLKRLPVKTDKPIPKSMIAACMDAINKVAVEAPIKINEMIIEDVLGTGANIIATRSMRKEDL